MQFKQLDALEQVITFNNFSEDLKRLLTGLPENKKRDIEQRRPGSRDDLASLLKQDDRGEVTKTVLRNPTLFRVLVDLQLCEPILKKHNKELKDYFSKYQELLDTGKIANTGGKEKIAVKQILACLR